MDQIQSLIIQRRYNKGENIVLPEQPMHCLFILNEGVVKVTRESNENKEHILYLLSENEFFGETNLFANIPSTISVSALTDTILCTISKADFQGLVIKYPSIALKVLEELSLRLNKLENMIEHTGGKSIDERIVQMLHDFSLKYGEVQETGTLIHLPLNREEIANYLGLSRETISRKLVKMDKQGDLKVIGHKKILLYHKKISSN
jgi:CRP/FNR family transcriptional regulator